jgi:hypothetical protein
MVEGFLTCIRPWVQSPGSVGDGGSRKEREKRKERRKKRKKVKRNKGKKGKCFALSNRDYGKYAFRMRIYATLAGICEWFNISCSCLYQRLHTPQQFSFPVPPITRNFSCSFYKALGLVIFFISVPSLHGDVVVGW